MMQMTPFSPIHMPRICCAALRVHFNLYLSCLHTISRSPEAPSFQTWRFLSKEVPMESVERTLKSSRSNNAIRTKLDIIVQTSELQTRCDVSNSERRKCRKTPQDSSHMPTHRDNATVQYDSFGRPSLFRIDGRPAPKNKFTDGQTRHNTSADTSESIKAIPWAARTTSAIDRCLHVKTGRRGQY